MDKINLRSWLKFFVFTLFAYLFYLIIQPFIPPIILALVFAIIFWPLTKVMIKKGIGRGYAAFLTVLITLLFIILPLITLISLMTNQAIIFVRNFDVETWHQAFNTITQWEFFGYHLDIDILREKIMAGLTTVGTTISSKSLTILSTLSNSLFLFFVFILLYYYFLKDQKILIAHFQKLLPFKKTERKNLFVAFKEISRTIFYGNTLVAIIAGIIAYVGFSIFGFKGPLIWSILAAIFSFIPTLGTLLIYLTGIIILSISEGWLLSFLFAAYFIIVDLLIRETFIKGKLLEDKLKFHPILVFLALVGGVTAFGSMGLIYGPLIVTFLGSLYQFHLNKKES